MSWYHVIAATGTEALVHQIWRAAVDAGVPLGGQAVFVRSKSEGRLALYFTPSAERLAMIFGANRCPAPSSRGLQLLVGEPLARPSHAAAAPEPAEECTHALAE